jgi:hypothetical protein
MALQPVLRPPALRGSGSPCKPSDSKTSPASNAAWLALLLVMLPARGDGRAQYTGCAQYTARAMAALISRKPG